VFFIEDDPNYSPHLREQAAINFFQWELLFFLLLTESEWIEANDC
jgi:hypothetical protein